MERKKRARRLISESKQRKQFNLFGEYKKAFSFIKESRNFIYIAILIFFIFMAFGFFFQDIINSFFNLFFKINLNKEILDYIKVILQETQGMGFSGLFGYILFRNLQSSFFGMVFGIILGIFPIMALIANGYLLGFVALISVKANGIFVLWKILPHGIFELPAVFISLGFGIKLGTLIFKRNEFKESFFNYLRLFLLIVFPLLLIAAIIESFLITLG